MRYGPIVISSKKIQNCAHKATQKPSAGRSVWSVSVVPKRRKSRWKQTNVVQMAAASLWDADVTELIYRKKKKNERGSAHLQNYTSEQVFNIPGWKTYG